MRLVIVFFIASIFSDSLQGQEPETKQLNIDTIGGTFLLEHDFRLNSKDDFIFHPSSIVRQPSVDKLKNGYKGGLFLFGDSLSLGHYKNAVISCGYEIMESEQFQTLLSQKINRNEEKINIEGYQFLNLKLTIVVGYLGSQELLVMWKQNKVIRKKIPLYYILEVL